MRINNDKNIQESGKIFALTAVLMNLLILTTVFGVFWLIQLILSQGNQLNAFIHGFRI